MYRPKKDAGSVSQGDPTCRPTICAASNFLHPPCDDAANVAIDSAAVTVDNLTTSTTRASSMMPPVTMTYDEIFGDRTIRGAENSGNRRSDHARGGSDVANNDQDLVEHGDARQRLHDVSSTSSFYLDGPSPSAPVYLDVDMCSFMRSASQPDIDVQSSLYEVYVQSPGYRRREQRHQQRRQFDEDGGHRLSDDMYRGPKHKGGYRHRRGAPGKQVSSSFENLVGSLLAAPPPRRRRHLANSSETLAVGGAASSDNAASLCGRGADTLPSLAAFMAATGTPTTAGHTSSSLVDATNDAVVPRHAPQRVRRVKHLFKSCLQHDADKT